MKFSLSRVTAPTDPVITLDEAHEQLRVDVFGSPPTNPEDALIESLVTAVTEEIDAGTGWLGRALCPQTWRLSLMEFPTSWTSASQRIRLPYPPFIEVESFTYVDTNGVTQTLIEGVGFRVIMDGDIAVLAPLFEETWPSAVRCDFDSVLITFRCGYASGGSPEEQAVPEQIKNFVKAVLTERFDSRGVDTQGVSSKISDAVMNSLNSLRVWSYSP